MPETLTIRLPEGLRRELDEFCSEAGASRNDVVSESLADHLFARRFRAQRSAMAAEASAKSVRTDEDVFREVS